MGVELAPEGRRELTGRKAGKAEGKPGMPVKGAGMTEHLLPK